MTYEQALNKLDETVIKDRKLKGVLSKALEKQIQKKPLSKSLENNGYAWEWTCPNCHIVKVTTEKPFCDDCGQALDWSGVDD